MFPSRGWMKLNRFLLIFFLACGCSVKQKQDAAVLETPISKEKTAYFVSVPITKLSSIETPCVEVDIQGKTFSMELDLGFQGDLTLTKQWIDLISSKSFIREKPMYGIRGKQYPTNLYRIPNMQIGKMTFFEPVLQESSSEFTKESTFVQNGGEPSPREPGRLGWKLFYNVNLAIDIKNSRIAFCDSLENLKRHGYAIESLTKTPLFLERGLVEFDAETSEGTLRCILDTGATWNILNADIKDEIPIEQVMWKSSSILEYLIFKIDSKEFGPVAFHRMPIKLPIHIKAILGMEFFEDHFVFLDFTEKFVYFAKNHWMTTNVPQTATTAQNSQ